MLLTNSSKARRRGSAVLFVWGTLIFAIPICAIVVDLGILNVDANRLQRACDAASLAGGSMLKLNGSGTINGVALSGEAYDLAAARREAIRVAELNGVTLTNSDITFPVSSTSPKAWYNNARIRVDGGFNRSFLFAPFLGRLSGQGGLERTRLLRHATVEKTPIAGFNGGTVPLVITTQDYNANETGTSFVVQLERMQGGNGFDSAQANASRNPPVYYPPIDSITPATYVVPATSTSPERTVKIPMGEAIGIDTDQSNNGKSPSWWEDGLAFGTTDPVMLLKTPGYDSDTAINANLGNQSRRAEEALETAVNSRMNRATALGYSPNESATDAQDVNYPNYPASAAPRIFRIMVANNQPSVSGNNFITVQKIIKVYLVATASDGGGSSSRIQMKFRILPEDENSETSNVIWGTPNTAGGSTGNGDTRPVILRMIDDI